MVFIDLWIYAFKDLWILSIYAFKDLWIYAFNGFTHVVALARRGAALSPRDHSRTHRLEENLHINVRHVQVMLHLPRAARRGAGTSWRYIESA